MGLLSGLEKFGFKSLEKVDVYEEEKKKQSLASANISEKKEITEEDLIYEKTHTCPVCAREIKNKTVKSSKAKLLGTDVDMRPRYQGIDPLKYDVISCNFCGYSALSRYFQGISEPQIKLIHEKISSSYKDVPEKGNKTLSYKEALERHKLSLLNAVVKRAKSSEKAYICLKTAWLMRGMLENLDETTEDYESKKKECRQGELECLSEAYKGFITAIATESTSTIAGMDSTTLDYLCSALAYELGDFSAAQKLISNVILSQNVNRRIKDKGMELKAMIQEAIKEQKEKKQ